MGIIFGKNGFLKRIGNTTYISDQNGNESISSIGETAYDSQGRNMTNADNTSFISNGKYIRQIGNSYFSDGKTYTKEGNTLYCSDGKSWTGQNTLSDDDIRRIIFHENR